VSLPRDLIP